MLSWYITRRPTEIICSTTRTFQGFSKHLFLSIFIYKTLFNLTFLQVKMPVPSQENDGCPMSVVLWVKVLLCLSFVLCFFFTFLFTVLFSHLLFKHMKLVWFYNVKCVFKEVRTNQLQQHLLSTQIVSCNCFIFSSGSFLFPKSLHILPLFFLMPKTVLAPPFRSFHTWQK